MKVAETALNIWGSDHQNTRRKSVSDQDQGHQQQNGSSVHRPVNGCKNPSSAAETAPLKCGGQEENDASLRSSHRHHATRATCQRERMKLSNVALRLPPVNTTVAPSASNATRLRVRSFAAPAMARMPSTITAKPESA